MPDPNPKPQPELSQARVVAEQLQLSRQLLRLAAVSLGPPPGADEDNSAAGSAAAEEAGLQLAAAAVIPSWARSMHGGGSRESRGVVMSMAMDDMFASEDDEPA